jgi:hypothetical protein
MEGYLGWAQHCLENRWTARAVGVRFYHPSSKKGLYENNYRFNFVYRNTNWYRRNTRMCLVRKCIRDMVRLGGLAEWPNAAVC